MNRRKKFSSGGPVTLLRLVFLRGGIHPSKAFRFIFSLVRLALNYPFAVGERLFARTIQKVKVKAPPVFIIGHFRSGTSLMYKLLSADSRWRCITEYELVFPYHGQFLRRILKPIIQQIINRLQLKHPNFNNYTIDLTDPNEDEALLMSMGASWSAYWSYIFPCHPLSDFDNQIPIRDESGRSVWKASYLYFLKRLLWKKYGRLLIKGPLNTARIDLLLELFPDAKFIHLCRDPSDVKKSMKKIWKTEILRFFCLQKPSQAFIDEQVARTHELLVSQFEIQKRFIPDDHLIEVSYDRLINEPLEVLVDIYSRLNIGLDFETRKALVQKIKRQANYRPTSYRNAQDSDEVLGSLPAKESKELAGQELLNR